MREMNGSGKRVTVQAHLIDFIEEVRVKNNLGNFTLALNAILSIASCERERWLNGSMYNTSRPDSKSDVNQKGVEPMSEAERKIIARGEAFW